VTTQTNGHADPVPMTEEQKFVFDLKGWIAIPGVLGDEEIESVKAHVIALKEDPDSLDPLERFAVGGPSQILLDHPVVVGVLREILAHDRGEDCYGFRCENGFNMVRRSDFKGIDPHGGGVGTGMFAYQCVNRGIFSGLTRVVWELNPVAEGDGTLLVSGSHKAAYAAPDAIHDQNSPIWEGYTCPAGSVLIFTESLTHSARPWTSKEHDRVAIFSCYNTVDSKWHDWDPDPRLVETMPPLRRTLFRPVRAARNLADGSHYGA
jgi:hypothetical protein